MMLQPLGTAYFSTVEEVSRPSCWRCHGSGIMRRWLVCAVLVAVLRPLLFASPRSGEGKSFAMLINPKTGGCNGPMGLAFAGRQDGCSGGPSRIPTTFWAWAAQRATTIFGRLSVGWPGQEPDSDMPGNGNV